MLKKGKTVTALSFIICFVVLFSLSSCSKKIVKPTPEDISEAIVEDEASRPPSPEKIDVTRINKSLPELRIDATQETEESVFLNDVYFEFDSYDLSNRAIQTLEENYSWLKKNSNIKILVEGHCDERGTIEYNLALGQRRAATVKKHLYALGIDAERIYTISYGEEKPVDKGHNEIAWGKNRRAHIVIVK